jgi:hypothetical protein
MTFRTLLRVGRRFAADRRGNFAVYGTIALMPILAGVALSVEFTHGRKEQGELQNLLDAAVLVGAREDTGQVDAAKAYLTATMPGDPKDVDYPVAVFKLADGRLIGTVTAKAGLGLSSALLGGPTTVSARSEAVFKKATTPSPCITVLANANQALLINSGANVLAKTCQVDVYSEQNPAFIMNAGSTLDISKLCVKGTKYIKNGGTISKLETNCQVTADPYKGKLTEPTVAAGCTTSGAKDGASHSLNPGVHCSVNFNGNPTITFKPGLHIIKGTMIINANSTVIATGVTFYFPDTDSKIQANGGLTMTATAPTSGTYKDILMFEKTSDATNNANKRQYIFNGSKGERLEGIIYLPNRDVTYNSTTNVTASKISLVVNTLIMNSANWSLTGAGSGGAGGAKTVYLAK